VLKDKQIEAICGSALRRARDTARIIATPPGFAPSLTCRGWWP
jgi:broad specificity phosphatase PhoE